MGATTLLRAALRRGRVPEGPFPTVERRLTVPERDVAAYAGWLGVPAAPAPLTWLYPSAQEAHLEAMIAPDARVPVVGMVHASNTIARVAPVPARAAITLRIAETDRIAGRRALGLDTVFLGEDGAPVAAMRSVYLLPGRAERAPKAAAADEHALPEIAPPVAWSRSAGRAYARVSGDYNPIHLAAPLARLLGQRGTILHGLAMAAVAWRDAGGSAALQTVTFRRPLVLPATSSTHHDPATGAFRVVGADGTVHARGDHGDLDAARAFVTTVAG